MRILSYARIGLGTLIVGAAAFAGCSSSNPPSTNNGPSTSSTAGTSSAGASTTGTGGTSAGSSSPTTGGSSTGTSGSASTTTTATGDGGTTTTGDAGGLCPSTLKDKITTCTVGVDQPCGKGCGPDLAAGSPPPGNLGTKTCTCQTGVYQCAACIYESPLPTCYQPSASPPTCDPTTADKGACTTPCTTGTGNDVCTILSDAGKLEGCVCITGSTGNIWTCATQWW